MPQQEQLNLAARAARWSANHWKTTVAGWLAFVVIAVAVGGVVGLQKQTDADATTGDSAKAERVLRRAGFRRPASESVLVQSKTRRVSSRAFRSTIADVVAVLEKQPQTYRIESPLAPSHHAQVSSD